MTPRKPRASLGNAALRGERVLEDIHSYRLDRNTFTVYLSGDPDADDDGESDEPGVEYNMADRFERNLATLTGINPKEPILVTMSSCGGSWEAGMQMFSAILACPNPVTVVAVKWARSMTSLIPLAADKFVMRPPAKYMFHYGTDSFSGIQQEVETYDVERRKANECMKRIYTARLLEQGNFRHLSGADIRRKIETSMQQYIDVWLTADDARRWGFVDEVQGVGPVRRAARVDVVRRQRMLDVLRAPITVRVRVT